MTIGIKSEQKNHRSKGGWTTSGNLHFTQTWRAQVAARKVVHAQDQRSSQTTIARADPVSDRAQLFHRPEHRFGVSEGRRCCRHPVGGGIGKGRAKTGSSVVAQAPASGTNRPAPGAGVCHYPPRPAEAQTPDAATRLGGVSIRQSRRLPLQPLLRAVSALAKAAGPGASP